MDKKKQDRPEDSKDVAKKASAAIFILVLILFLAVLSVTYFIELKLGKTAGTVALVVIAVFIGIYLYRKEIIAWIKKKRGGND